MAFSIFGIPIYKTKIPNHNEIKEDLLSQLKQDNILSPSDNWYCDCYTTHGRTDININWDLFFTSIHPILHSYLESISFKTDLATIGGSAWANGYSKGQHQDVHCHTGDKNVFSCAYSLHVPKDSESKFIFYNSSYEPFPAETNLLFNTDQFGKSFDTNLEEGEIIFFPSTLDHFVTYNKSNEIRYSVSANFGIESIDQAN